MKARRVACRLKAIVTFNLNVKYSSELWFM